MADRCSDCGASTDRWTCEELFQRLLALDHQRLEPWGPFHGISVACYLLQHPSPHGPQHRGARLELVATFCEEGLDGFRRVTGAARARNSHRASTQGAAPTPDDPGPSVAAFGTTIHDVAVDGTFPADGFAERVGEWADAVRAGWPREDP